jgi:hypothetical protein
MLYTAKCYWPGITAADFARIASSRLGAPAAGRDNLVYLGALLFPDDDLVLCLFEGSSRDAAKRATERAVVPCERIMDSAWLPAAEQPGASQARRRPDRQPRLSGLPVGDEIHDQRRSP